MPVQRDWEIFRRKTDPTLDDPPWVVDSVDPGASYGTVGGVTAAGNYTITYTPVDALVAPIVNTFNRAGAETDAQIAAALVAIIAPKIAPGGLLEDYLGGVVSVGDQVRSLPRVASDSPTTPGALPFTVTGAAPGGATLIISPDDTFPICRRYQFWETPVHFRNSLEISFRATDTAGLLVPDNNSLIFNAEVVERVNRESIAGVVQPVGVTRTIVSNAHPVGEKIVVPLNGTLGVGVRLSTIAGVPTPTFDVIEMSMRQGNL
jgi:hypothetical protein